MTDQTFSADEIVCPVGIKFFDNNISSPSYMDLKNMAHIECRIIIKRCRDPLSAIFIRKDLSNLWIHVFAHRVIRFNEEFMVCKFSKDQLIDPLAWDHDAERLPEEMLAMAINDVMEAHH